MATYKSGDMEMNMPESKGSAKGKAIAVVVGQSKRGVKKGFAVGDFILRLCAIGATLGAAVSMGTADELLPFTTQFFQFEAEYDDFDAFRFFVISIAIASGYLLISLPFSIICIIRPLATAPRLTLVIFDAVIAGVTIAAGSAAASIVYLAHNGNPSTNWLPICQQFGDFCQSASGAVIGSLIAAALLFLQVIFAAFALKRS